MNETTDLYLAMRWPSVCLQYKDAKTFVDPRDHQEYPRDHPDLVNEADGRFGRPIREVQEIVRSFAGTDARFERYTESAFYVRGVSEHAAQLIQKHVQAIRSENRLQMWSVQILPV